MTDLYRVAKLCLATLICLLLSCACASAAGGRIIFSSAWDDNFLYAGFIVDDQNVTGKNRTPNSNPWEDDEIELLLDVKHSGATAITADTYRMAVSAAGGCSFASGKDGQWEARSISTYKYGPTVQGTLNNTEDIDRSFSVEIALPWSEIGGKPTVGQVMAINVLRTIRGEGEGFVSLAPEAKTLSDLLNPSKWVDIEFTGPGAPTEGATGKLLCPQVSQPPLIDGLPKAKEWSQAAVAQIDQPDLQKPEPKQASAPAEKVESKQQRYPNEPLVLTRFYYWYQGDSRKPAPFDHIRNADGSFALTDEPIDGAGPWMTYDRVQWYKDELQDIRKAGVDAILPVYRGDYASRTGYADKGLDCLAQALKELKAEGKEYPLVAMFLDTACVPAIYQGVKPDLRQEETQRTLYGMISDFFSRVPDEFLLLSQFDASRGKLPACVVFVSDSDNFSDLDAAFVRYCNAAFARDFRGRLIWIGGSGFKQKAPNLDGYISFGAGPQFDDTGWLDVAAVGPGFDDSAVRPQSPKIRPRRGGKTYQDDWSQLIAKKPDLIVVDSWNGLHEGSDICPTRQYGYNYTEMTAVESMRYRGMRELDAAFLRHNAPAVVAPQSIHQADVVVKNVGTRAWKAREGFGLSYRWYKNDKFVEDGVVRIPLLRDVLPGHIATVSTGILAQDKAGQAIPPGIYELHFEMLRSPDKWFSEAGDTPLVVPVRVGLPTEGKARFISSTLPTFMKAGGTYPFKTIIRNDGANPWKRAASAEIICRLYKVSAYAHFAPEEKVEPVNLKSVRVSLPSDTEPGRMLELNGTLSLVDPEGKPMHIGVDDFSSYRVRWALWADKKWLGESDGSPYCQTVEIQASDHGAQFLGCVMPREIDAAKSVTTSVQIKNNGPDPWKGGQYQLGYHWYHIDGAEAAWERPVAAISGAASGEMVSVQIKLVPPANDGQYYLVWDIARDGTWASTRSSLRGGDTLVVPVTVKNGKLVHVDLGAALNVTAAGSDMDPGFADFDGKGACFPSEFLPPTVGSAGFTTVVPAGYLCSGVAPVRVTFRYPDKGADRKGAVNCDGQILSFAEGRYSTAHILGAAVSPSASGDIELLYDSGPTTSPITMTAWDSLANGETPALVTPHRRSATGDQPGVKCYLKQYQVKLDPARKLKSIRLPKNPDMRVLAVTLERP
ncbi:MAG: sugar-binding protein [Armatimonadota bacterium]|nr:sugar-binding protein [Armatimonadota bacterium]